MQVPLVLLLTLCATTPALAQSNVRETTVGQAGLIEQLVIPGPKLQVRPMHSGTPLVLRIVSVFPHGSDFRYDLEYYGLEPGEYDLTESMQRADGTDATVDPIRVTVSSVLPDGQILPHDLSQRALPRVGGYRMLLLAGGIAWLAGFLLILFWRTGERGGGPGGPAAPRTLADRLRPLLEEAMSGELPAARHSELEMTLVAWWRKLLKLDDLPAAESVRQLRDHEQAGPLLRQLESWLHQPADRREQADLGELLKPYEAMPASVLDTSEPMEATP